MSLDRFSNKQDALANNGTIRGIEWSNDILPSLMLDTRTITLSDNVTVEAFVYTRAGNYLTGGNITDFKLNADRILIDYAAVLNNFNIPRGYFEVATNIHENLIGTNEEPILQIKEISPDRRELLLQLVPLEENKFAEYDGSIDRYMLEYGDVFSADIALNFGENKIYKLINQKAWNYSNSLVVRLYSPLAEDIIVNDVLWLVRQLADPYIDTVQLHSGAPDLPITTLRGANFDIDTTYNTITETEFKNWNDLLDTNLSTSQQIINSYFSGSLSGLDLGIDYTNFSNYVFYGSSYERLSNFKYKLELLEYYKSQNEFLNSSTGDVSVFSTNISINNDRIQNVLGTFDNFERWLYYEPTASLTTHGVEGGVVGAQSYRVSPWPKYLSGSVYYTHHTTSSIAVSWFNGIIATASLYDQENPNALVKTIPLHIREDANNSEYELFVNMIGQHFDILYTYINALTKIYRPEEQPKLGVHKDGLYEIAQSMGWKLANGRQASSLWQYKLGYNESGSYTTTGSLFSKSDEDITTEIWRRTVNNLPYLLKTKGTSRSIKALMNIYGIPQTLLSIREYGGPHPDAKTPALIEDRFGYKLLISGSSGLNFSGSILYHTIPYVTSSGNWHSGIYDSVGGRVAPITREFRFSLPRKQSMALLLHRNTDAAGIGNGTVVGALVVEHTRSYSGSSDYGRVWLSHYVSGSDSPIYSVSSSTDWLPLYDGDMWNLRWWWTGGGTGYNTNTTATNNIYYVQVQKASDYINGKIIHSTSASVDTTGYSNSYISWHGVPGFRRMMQIGGGIVSSAGVTSTFMNSFNHPRTSLSGSYFYIQEYREWLERLDQNTFDIHTLNPTSYVSSLNATGSYHTLVRHYTFGSDGNAIDHNQHLVITSSHPANNIKSFTTDTTTDWGFGPMGTGSSYAFAARSSTGSIFTTSPNFPVPDDPERGRYTPFEETYYIDAISLGGQLPRSEKIRLEDNYLIRRLSPTNTAEVSSFDYAPVDSNRLGLFYSQADQANKDIFDHIGDVAMDDYIGNPEDEFDYQYPQLRGFSEAYWKKYTNRNDINAFIRVFSQFDFTLFSQIKQLLPARVDEAMGLLVEPHALERNKIALTKRIIVENPQYDILFTGLQPTASSEVLTEYTASISTSYVISTDSIYHSGSATGYIDTGNTYANIVLRDHVVPMSYLTEEVPVDNLIQLHLTTYATLVSERSNVGLAREMGITGSSWLGITSRSPILIGQYTGGGNDLLRTRIPTGSVSQRLEIQYPLYNQSDIVYDFTIKTMALDSNAPGTVLERCSLLTIDDNEIVTELCRSEQAFTAGSGAGDYKTFRFNNIRIPAYTKKFAVGIQYKETSGTDGAVMYEDFVQVTASIDSVYHSAIRPEIIDQTLTAGYYKKVYHYSGSINTTDKILKNAYHATSQSLGLYYSSSIVPFNYQNDEILQYNNPRYDGCKLTGPDININSNIAAINNTPVIEVYETNANQLIFTEKSLAINNNQREPGNLRIR